MRTLFCSVCVSSSCEVQGGGFGPLRFLMLEVIQIVTLVLLDVLLLQKIADHMRDLQEKKKIRKEQEMFQMPPSAMFRGE